MGHDDFIGLYEIDGNPVYEQKVSKDAFKSGFSRFLEQIDVDDKGYSDVLEKGSACSFSLRNCIGGKHLEIYYSPSENRLSASSSDESLIKSFASIMSDTEKLSSDDGRHHGYGMYIDEDVKGGGIISRLYGFIRNRDKENNIHASYIDPSLYDILDPEEKRLINNYRQELVDFRRHILRKRILSSQIHEINRSMECLADESRGMDSIQEGLIDDHEVYRTILELSKESDYIPMR